MTAGVLHTCDVCRKASEWGRSWQWYGTAEHVAMRTCSDKCRRRVLRLPQIRKRGSGYDLHFVTVEPAVIAPA